MWYKVVQLDLCLTPREKSARNKVLNIRPKIVKFLKEIIEKELLDMGLGNDFLAMTPKA
jgi:hypothetical protein